MLSPSQSSMLCFVSSANPLPFRPQHDRTRKCSTCHPRISIHCNSPRITITSAAKQPQNRPSRHLPISERYAGGTGPLSAEFLSVSGSIATLFGLLFLLPLLLGHPSPLPFHTPLGNTLTLTTSSFAYGLLLARFNLKKTFSIKLTVLSSLVTRFLFAPLLSHLVSLIAYVFVRLATGTPLATAAPVPVRASLAIPSGALSSFLLLAVAPAGFSPLVATLALHIHTTLLAILTTLTLLLFPLFQTISHIAATWARRTLLFNVASIIPPITPPPSMAALARVTTLPVLLGLAVSKALPHRWAAMAALVAIPVAWVCSLRLMASAVGAVVAGNAAGLLGSIALCGSVVALMWVVGRAVARGLSLDERSTRTLVVYLCMQGAIVGAGVMPMDGAMAPVVAAMMVGLVFGMAARRGWGRAVIRTSSDVIL